MHSRHDALPVLASIVPVIRESRWVSFHPEHIETAVREWGDALGEGMSWEHPCHFFDGTEATVRWIFVLDVLNHCFWPDKGEPVWTVTYGGVPYSGYWALAASLRRAVDEGRPIADASYLVQLPGKELRDVFAGEGTIPLFEQRLFNLREAGRVLLAQWEGDFVHLLRAAGGSAAQTVESIVASFPSFRDEALYGGRRVQFWKRAQLVVSDLSLAFSKTSWGAFHDLDVLTAFADYKLPQVLRTFGVVAYAPELAARVDRLELIEPGSEEEVEIRAVTIRAVESFRQAFLAVGRSVTSAWVDNWLWQLGQREPFRKHPYHRCRTIFY